MKIYTKTGDKGETSLFTGERVKKNHARVEAYGSIDELNSVLAFCSQSVSDSGITDKEKIVTIIECIQNDLFNLGAELASPNREKISKNMISRVEVEKLENLIDHFQDKLPALRTFILPGGNYLNAYFHLARTVTRRVERMIVSLMEKDKISVDILMYLNRLSDLFFTLARVSVIQDGKKENAWNDQKGIKHLSL